jgi:hypothetical protein
MDEPAVSEDAGLFDEVEAHADVAVEKFAGPFHVRADAADDCGQVNENIEFPVVTEQTFHVIALGQVKLFSGRGKHLDAGGLRQEVNDSSSQKAVPAGDEDFSMLRTMGHDTSTFISK